MDRLWKREGDTRRHRRDSPQIVPRFSAMTLLIDSRIYDLFAHRYDILRLCNTTDLSSLEDGVANKNIYIKKKKIKKEEKKTTNKKKKPID